LCDDIDVEVLYTYVIIVILLPCF